MAADASIEKFPWRAVMPRAGEEEQVAPFIVLQSETHAGLRAVGHEVCNRC